MRICIIGAGSLGSTIGGMLALGGSDVWLVNRRQDHVDAVNARGLTLRFADGDRSVAVHAATTAAGLGLMDLVIILVKSIATGAAIIAARDVVGPDTAVISLQNGLGQEDLIAEAFGAERTLAGKTYVGGVLLAPGLVLNGAAGKETIIGELDGTVTDRVERIAEVFTHAGLATRVSTNIRGTMWDKLLVNVATGALSAITRLTYGELYAVPELKACALAAVDEAIAVATALGVELSSTHAEDAWVLAAAGLPADFKASMLQSIERGSLTEVDFINGAVVRAGEHAGIPTPVNRTLVACVKGVEASLTSR